MKKNNILSTLLAFGCIWGGDMMAQKASFLSAGHSISDDREVKTMKKQQLRNNKSGTIIWGAGGTTGAAEGEFSTNFVQGSSVTSSTNWNAVSINQSSGAVTPGAAYWTRSTLGYSQGAYWSGTTPVSSASSANGVAIFDSDFLDNGGTPNAFGAGTSPGDHKGELVSPVIDLTGYTDSALSVDFFVFYRNFQITELSVSLSVDGGTTWTTESVLNRVNSMSPENASIVFSSVTAGVSNLTNCRLKFTFDGYYYFAILDDVSISTATPYDLTIQNANGPNNAFSDEYESMHIGNATYSIPNQILPLDLRIGANVKNLGFQNVTPSDSATLEVIIQRSTVGTWTNVHTQTINIDSLQVPSNGVAYYANLSDTTWMSVGDYRALYVANMAGDGNSSNDTMIQTFGLTDDYLSKVSKTTNGFPSATRGISPGGGPYKKIEWGSMFSSPNGGTDNLVIDSIAFTYRIPNNYSGSGSQVINAQVYEFVDGSSSAPLDGFLNNQSELVLRANGSDTVSGFSNSFYYSNYIPVLSIADSGRFFMEDNKIYYISIYIEGDTLTLDNSIQFGAVENVKTYAMNSIGAGLGNPFLSPASLMIQDMAGTTLLYTTGYGLGRQPSIGVNISVGDPCANFSTSVNVTNGCSSNDASANVVATGGTMPYNYFWSDGTLTSLNSNLSSGVYGVTTTDANGCSIVDSVTVNASPLRASILLVNNPTGASPTGALDSRASGGTMPYAYLWSNGDTSQTISGIASGTYSLTVTDANNCTSNTSITIGGPSCPASILPTNLRANFITSTTAQIEWDEVVGSNVYYMVRYKESGQPTWQTFFTTSDDSLQVSGLTPNTAYIYIVRTNCNGNWSGQSFSHFRTLTNDCSMPTGVNEQWVLGTQVKFVWTLAQNASKYQIRYKDSSASSWTMINVNGRFDFRWVGNLTPNTTYTWQIRSSCRFDNASATRWSAPRTFTTQGSTSSQTSRTKLADPMAQQDFTAEIYPNPTNGQLNIVLQESLENRAVEVLDLSGRVVYQSSLDNTSGRQQIGLDQLSNGVYFLRISDKPQELYKIVLQK